MLPSDYERYQAEGLEDLTRRCPDDGTPMKTTGIVGLHPESGFWVVEYWCPVEEEARLIYDSDRQERVAAAPKKRI